MPNLAAAAADAAIDSPSRHAAEADDAVDRRRCRLRRYAYTDLQGACRPSTWPRGR